ncbi:hypothetical protein H2200_001288 [Cladophialophora chaetospira]|uniref:Major facilitator superfamily (MFS) profile domain-containing protein n=1 Tax=Cladophialophora chaetospira TaxID=386627 RepID=A0AA38XKL7_9EURO|nr:hypothetical protein H2200_001288 [Cladophialophora chaetospira]
MSEPTFKKRHFNWRAFAMSFAISLGAIAFGYPLAIIGTTLSQPSFVVYMNLIDEDGLPTSNADSLVGAMSGVFMAGGIIGIGINIWVMDRFGRKMGVVTSSFMGLLGAAGTTGARNVAMFIAFRFFAGWGAWAALCVGPTYVSELAPPKIRGLFVGLTGVILMFGQALASYVGLGFFSVESETSAQWRGPLGVSMAFPLLSLIMVNFVSESPRWLLMQGREPEARDIVMTLHGKTGDEQDFAMAEFFQMKKQAEFDRTKDSSWRACLTKPSYRRRFELCGFYGCLSQTTGLLVISTYGSVLYSTLGYGPRQQIVFQCGYITVGVCMAAVGDLLVDVAGRRILMMIGYTVCICWMCIETAMVALYASPVPENPNRAGISMAIAALYLFLASFTCTLDVTGFTYYADVFPNHLRAKGVSVGIGGSAVVTLILTQCAGIAFRTIGWKYFLVCLKASTIVSEADRLMSMQVFIICPALGVVVIYFMFPETKGLPLEEVARLFGDENEVMVFSEDIVIDHDHHQLTVRAERHVVYGEGNHTEQWTEKITKQVAPESMELETV